MGPWESLEPTQSPRSLKGPSGDPVPPQDIDDDESLVQFSDDSTSLLTGKITISVAISSSNKRARATCLYVLHGFQCDILLEDFLAEMPVFETYSTELRYELGMAIQV
jgi:hypothetical protein